MSSLLFPLVSLLAFLAIAVVYRRRFMTGGFGEKELFDSLRADSLAARLGLAVVEGDPTFNLMGVQRQMELGSRVLPLVPFVWKRSERRVRMAGAPGGRPTELVYHDVMARRDLILWREWSRHTEARIAIDVRAPFPDFETFTRSPQWGIAPKPTMRLPDVSFGDALLDGAYVLQTCDARVGPLVASALRSIGDLNYVHIAGEGGRLSFVFTNSTVSMFATGDRILHVLDEAARAIETFAAPHPGSTLAASQVAR